MERSLRIGQSVIDAIATHARDDAPLECCGLLIGAGDHVVQASRAINLDRSPRRYTLDPRTYLQVSREARTQGLDVVGAYHSHPKSPPIPSETDLAEGADAPFVYLIAGPVVADEPIAIRAWQKTGRAFTEILLRIEA